MFEHKVLDGEKYRLIPSSEDFIKSEVLEHRDPKRGQSAESAARYQHAVAGNLLVERFLPPVSIGDKWPHDAASSPWWGVVDNPPHAGIVADFNEAFGGLYRRKLAPDHNVVGFAEKGEEVVLKSGIYSVTRSADGKAISAANLVELRNQYYS